MKLDDTTFCHQKIIALISSHFNLMSLHIWLSSKLWIWVWNWECNAIGTMSINFSRRTDTKIRKKRNAKLFWYSLNSKNTSGLYLDRARAKKNIFGNEIPCSLHSIFVLCTGLCSCAYVSGILYIFAAGGDDVSFSIIHNVKHKFGLWMLHESSRNTIFNICHVQNAYRTLLSSQFLHCILLYTCHRINAI